MLEEDNNIGDMLIIMQSTISIALVFGDYVINNGNIYNGFDDGDFSTNEGNWWSLLLQVKWIMDMVMMLIIL
jgi:hypothetical protein